MAEANGGEYKNPALTSDTNKAKTGKTTESGGKDTMVDHTGMNKENKKLERHISDQQR